MSNKTLKLIAACGTAALISLTVRATVVDYTMSTSGELNGAVYSIDNTQPAGTGVFDPFLTIQANGTNDNFDTKRVPVWNHEIQIADLNTQKINGQSV